VIRKVALLAVAGSLALTGCGTGTNAESSKPTQLTEGVNFSQNGIDVRNLFVLGPVPGAKLPAGSSLSVYGTLINNGSGESDALTGVSVADGLVENGVVKGGAIELPAHKAVNLAQPTAAQPSASPSATQTSADGASSERSGQQEGGTAVVLKNTKKEFLGGEHLRLTLQFRNARAITVTVQVIPASREYASLAPATATTPTPTQSSAPATSGDHGDQAESGDHAETLESPAPEVETTPVTRPSASKKPKNQDDQEH